MSLLKGALIVIVIMTIQLASATITGSMDFASGPGGESRITEKTTRGTTDVMLSGESVYGSKTNSSALGVSGFVKIGADKARIKIRTPEYLGDVTGYDFNASVSYNSKLNTIKLGDDYLAVPESNSTQPSTSNSAGLQWNVTASNATFRERIVIPIENKPMTFSEIDHSNGSLEFDRIISITADMWSA
jgi:hypothetical protein